MAVTAAVAAVASVGYSVYSGERAASAQKDAQAEARTNATKTAALADEANNKVNQKNPDTGALQSANAQAAKAGGSGTMLTGSAGVDPSALQLGKNTLLGA